MDMRNETVGILPNKIFYLMLSASMNLQFEIVFLGKLQLFNNRIIRLRKSIMWPRLEVIFCIKLIRLHKSSF